MFGDRGFERAGLNQFFRGCTTIQTATRGYKNSTAVLVEACLCTCIKMQNYFNSSGYEQIVILGGGADILCFC